MFSFIKNFFAKNPCVSQTCDHWCKICHDHGRRIKAYSATGSYKHLVYYSNVLCDCPMARVVSEQEQKIRDKAFQKLKRDREEADAKNKERIAGPPDPLDPYWNKVNTRRSSLEE